MLGRYPVHENCGGALVPVARLAKKLGGIQQRKFRTYCGKCRSFVPCSDEELRLAEGAALAEDVQQELAVPGHRSKPREFAAPVPDGWEGPDFVFRDGRMLWWRADGSPTLGDLLGHIEHLVGSREQLATDLHALHPTLIGIDAFPFVLRVSGAVEIHRVVVDSNDLAQMIRELRAVITSNAHP